MLKLPLPLTTPATEPAFRCTACSDTGWVEVVLDGETVPRSKRCTGPAGTSCPHRDAERGAAPGVPKEEQASTWDNYTRTGDNSAALVQAQYFLDGIHPGLYIHGTVGSGKTRLACTLLNTLWTRGIGVRFKRCPELLVQLQPGKEDDEDGRQLWATMVNTPVLCLDDVGANQGTDFARRMLQTLYDARLDGGRRTIWTSNLDLDELATFLGDDRLPSRVVGNCAVVPLSGKDWRLKGLKRSTRPGPSK